MAQAINEITVKISQCEHFGNNKKNLMKRGKKMLNEKLECHMTRPQTLLHEVFAFMYIYWFQLFCINLLMFVCQFGIFFG